MPIEIKELHVRVHIEEEKLPLLHTHVADNNGGTVDQERLIEICVEKVLEILKQDQRR